MRRWTDEERLVHETKGWSVEGGKGKELLYAVACMDMILYFGGGMVWCLRLESRDQVDSM